MRSNRLGSSGLWVSELALGAMTFGMEGWGCDEATSVALVDRYLDAGGTVIDTASGYGASEEICGRALQGRRDQVVIATKFGMPLGPGPHDKGASRIHIKRACEQSLRRLQTDHIDLYQQHVDDLATPLEETLAALDDLVREGKVLYVGVSNMHAYRVMKALDLSDRTGASRFISFQGQYNLIVRSLEREHFPLFAEEGLGLISWSPLAAGMLTGKVTRDAAASDQQTRLVQRGTDFDALQRNEHGFTVLDAVLAGAARLGCTPAQLALAWQRTRPVASVILGVRTLEQLEDNLGALDVEIPDDLLDDLNAVSAPHAEYPGAFIDIFQGWLRGRGSVRRDGG